MNLNKTFAGALIGATMLVGAQAGATTYIDPWNPSDIYLDVGGNTVQHQHNAANVGFNAATETVTGGKLSLWLYDNGDADSFLWWTTDDESFKYSYDGIGWTNGEEVDGSSWSFDKFTFTPALSELLDGKLSFSLKSNDGDFYFARSELEITTTQKTSVPEPATLGLLSLGLLGVGFAARRKQSV